MIEKFKKLLQPTPLFKYKYTVLSVKLSQLFRAV